VDHHRPGYTERYNAALRAQRLASKSERPCEFCAATIPVTMNRNARYCSGECLTAAHCARHRERTAASRADRLCAYFDGPLGEHRFTAPKKAALYCSVKCYNAAYHRAHREEISVRDAARYAVDHERMYAVGRAHRVAHPEVIRLWRAHNREAQSEYFRGRREALAGLPSYPKMDPWPAECQVCGDPLESVAFPSPMSESFGHEPPIRWAERHPEYNGSFVLRPEHLVCNQRKHDRPDWEIERPIRRLA
jgi:hypothetical protein